MHQNYSNTILIAVLIFVFMAIPSQSKGNTRSKFIPHTIKSASELDYPPFSIVRNDGTADGFSVELLKAVVHAVGHDISFDVAPWNEIKQDLINGHIDVLPLASYSAKREKVLDFTAPYLRMYGTIFVRRGEKVIRGEIDLKGKEVLVMRGDTAHEYAISKNLSDKLILTDSFEQAMILLSHGKHDAVIIQQLVGFQLIKKLKISNIVDVGSFMESSLKPVSKPLSGFEQKFCIAVQEGNKELLSLLNEGLTLVISSGQYVELYNKWFGPVLPQPIISVAGMVKYLLIVLLPILLVIGIVGIWYLKHQVAQKTKSLRSEIKERRLVEDTLRKKTHDIGERVKELNCLYEISTLLEDRDASKDDIFQNLADLLPPAWQYPKITCAQITIDDTRYKTENFQQTQWKQSRHILMHGENIGTVEVYYKKQMHKIDEGPFLKEERKLINDIAEQIGRFIERGQAKEAIQTYHKRFFTVLNSIDATIYVADMETYEVLFMNKYMIEQFGRDMTGEICWKVFRGESKPCPFCTNDRLIDENGRPTGVCTWQDKNPVSGKWYNNYDRAMEWTDGRFVRLQVATDITRFKKMETQLQQTHKMETIGILAGGIAHDFNNILFPIVGHTEMLMEDVPEDSPFLESLNEIYSGAIRASELVKQILTFSRQESGEIQLIKMQPVIREALKLIRSTIPATIDIKQNIQSDCGAIKADPTQIHQIIMNLATNASHAMGRTSGELMVSLKKVELGALDLIQPDMIPGVYACLTVADTGVGMEKHITEKIFDPFFTTKEQGKGTGMGLSVVHGIITRMNGAIQVYSEPGKGTKFHVYLPVENFFLEKQVTNPKTKVQAGTEQILLVDDEQAILTMGKKMLRRLGYQVTSRTSSIEALEVFKDNPDKFDVIITDMAMPNMSGDKLSYELNKIRPGIPVLLCTGFSEQMTKKRAASLGIKGFLLKPIVMKDLSQKIRDVLDQ